MHKTGAEIHGLIISIEEADAKANAEVVGDTICLYACRAWISDELDDWSFLIRVLEHESVHIALERNDLPDGTDFILNVVPQITVTLGDLFGLAQD